MLTAADIMQSNNILAFAAGVLFALTSADSRAGTVEPDGSPPAAARHSAAEAGVRYGQAMGVARVCYGLRTTEAATQLGRSYQGAEALAFRAEAERILASWQDALSCAKSGGPNECRLIYEMSCRDAWREIGPQGSAFPGLVERVK